MNTTSQSEAVKQATVEFTDSGKVIHWTECNANLLEFAEEHNIPALSSCRSGSCGACAVQLLKGNIVYEQMPTIDLGGSEILLCCAKPASSYIKIKL